MAKASVGDRVRFLNAQGGGIVRRIEGKVAWVEGDDGFELPTPLHECVVVNECDTFVPAYRTPREIQEEKEAKRERRSGASQASQKVVPTPSHTVSQHKKEEFPPPQTFLPERPEREQLSIYIAWLPEDFVTFGNSSLECYLINDSNYHGYYTLSAQQSNGYYRLVSTGIIERDTKLLVDTIPLAELNDRECLHLSFLPYKPHKAYKHKEPVSIDFKPDGVKFFKRHCYVDNPFFDEDALVLPLVEQDKSRHATVAPADLEALAESIKTPRAQKEPARPQREEKRKAHKEPLVVDLHAAELLPTLQGMSHHDILQHQLSVFRETMDKHLRNKGMEIIFIHGKGEGILRKAVLDDLRKRYPKASAQDASFQEYGFGATKVTIH